MTPYEWFLAAGIPLIVVVLALVGSRVFLWDMKRRDRMHPGE